MNWGEKMSESHTCCQSAGRFFSAFLAGRGFEQRGWALGVERERERESGVWRPTSFSFFLFLNFWSYPMAYGTLVPWLGIEPVPPALEGTVLTPGLPGKSWDPHLNLSFATVQIWIDRSSPPTWVSVSPQWSDILMKAIILKLGPIPQSLRTSLPAILKPTHPHRFPGFQLALLPEVYLTWLSYYKAEFPEAISVLLRLWSNS